MLRSLLSCAVALLVLTTAAAAGEPGFRATAGGQELVHGPLRFEVGSDGHVRAAPPSGDAWVGLDFLSVARGAERADAVAPTSLYDAEGALTLARGAADEIYQPRAGGVEQRFVLRALPGASGADLVLSARLTGCTARPLAGAGLALSSGGKDLLYYGGATAIDAAGRKIAAPVAVEGDRLTITVPGAWLDDAVLPLTIDPLLGPATAISTAGTSEGRPDVSYSIDSRVYLAVYEETFNGAKRIMAARYNESGTPLDANASGPGTNARVLFQDPSPTPAISGTMPHVAWLGGGNDRFLVAWIERGGAGVQIRGAVVRNVTSTAPTFDAPFTITTTAGTHADFAALAIGGRTGTTAAANLHWIVVYEAVLSAADHDIYVTRINPNGTISTQSSVTLPWGAATGTKMQRQPAINKLALGTSNWLFAWSEEVPTTVGDFDVFTRAFSSANTSNPTSNNARAPFASNVDAQENPSLAGGTTNFFLAFESNLLPFVQPPPFNRGIAFGKITATTSGASGTMPDSYAFDDRLPAVGNGVTNTTASHQDYFVAFTRRDPSAATPVPDVYTVRFDDAFLAREGPTRLTTNGTGDLPAAIGLNDATIAARTYGLVWQDGVTPDPFFARIGATIPGALNITEAQSNGGSVAVPNDTPPADGRVQRYMGPVALTATSSFPTATIVLKNDGPGPITITQTPTSDSPEFDVALSGSVIPVGTTSQTITITFHPTPTSTAGIKEGTITFGHDGPTAAAPGLFKIRVRGVLTDATPPQLDLTSGTVNLPIPNISSMIQSTIRVPPLGEVSRVVVNFTITHPNVSEVHVTLRPPHLGTNNTIILVDELTKTGANFTGTLMDDTTATLSIADTNANPPYSSGPYATNVGFRLTGARGTDAQGDWTLLVWDDLTPFSQGTLVSWSLHLESAEGTERPGMLVYEGSTSGHEITNAESVSLTSQRNYGLQIMSAAGGTPAVRDIVVQNPGTVDLHLTSATFAGSSFAVVGAPFPRTVPANGTTTIQVRFDPQVTGKIADTLTIANDSPMVSGPFLVNVEGFGLDQAPVTQSFTFGGSVPIPAQFNAIVSATALVSLSGQVLGVTVTSVNITHPDMNDLELRLIDPAKTTIARLSDNRPGTDNTPNFVNLRFDDYSSRPIVGAAVPLSGTYKPEDALTRFQGVSPFGFWTLEVKDTNTIVEPGTINGFTIEVTTTRPSLIVPIFQVTDVAANTAILNGQAPAGTLELGAVLTGASASAQVAVESIGTASFQLQAPASSGRSSAVLVADHASVGFPHTTAPGEVVTFDASLRPVVPGAVRATIGFGHDVTTTASPFTFGVSALAVDIAPVSVSSTDVPRTVSDVATTTSALTTAQPGVIADVRVRFTIPHGDVTDLSIFLIHPDGTRIELSSKNGSANGDNYTSTVLDDAATTSITSAGQPFTGRFRPEQRLADLRGKPAAGTWQLEVQDAVSGDTGTISSWSLDLATVSAPFADLQVREGLGVRQPLVANHPTIGGWRDFGRQPLAVTTPAHVFHIRNGGGAPLTVSSIALGGAGAASFAIDASAFATPLGAFETRELPVTFRPGATGTVTAQLTIVHDGTFYEDSPYVFDLRGQGIAAPNWSHGTTTNIAADGIPTAIPDAPSPGIEIAIPVNMPGFVDDIDVHVSLLHTTNNVRLTLVHPDGRELLLSNPRNGVNFTGTIFDDSAAKSITGSAAPYTGPHRAEGGSLETFARFFPAAGIWIVRIADTSTGGVIGTITELSLDIRTVAGGKARLTVTEGVGGVSVANGSGRDFGNTFVGNPGTSVTYVLSNGGTEVLHVTGLGAFGPGASQYVVSGPAGFDVPIGATAGATVTFQPSSAGIKSATLRFTHDGAITATSPFDVALVGYAFDQLATHSYTGSPLAVANPSTTVATIDVPADAMILDVNVVLNIDHLNADDLDITLESPDGTRIKLTEDDGGTANGFLPVTLDDQATVDIGVATSASTNLPITGRFRPKEPLAAFNGGNQKGTWTLRIFDDVASNSGQLISWSLEIGTQTQLEPILEVREAGGAKDLVPSGGTAQGTRDFGQQTTLATTRAQTYVVHNRGSATLDLSGLAMQGAGAGDFTIVPPASTSLAPGASTTFGVTFRPSALGARTAEVRIGSNTSTSFSANPFLLPLRGEGVSAFTTLRSSDVPKTVPDFVTGAAAGTPPPWATRASLVSNLPGGVADVDVTVTVTHGRTNQLDIYLEGPDGTVVTLANDKGGTTTSGGYVDCTFDDESATALPGTTQVGAITGRFKLDTTPRLSSFDNRRAAGVWTLHVADDDNGTAATNAQIVRFDLDITTTLSPSPLIEVFEIAPPAADKKLGASNVARDLRMFPLTPIGASTAPYRLRIDNPSFATLHFAPMATVGDFAVTGLPTTIAAESSADVTVSYAPRAAGAHKMTLSFAHDATGTATPIEVSFFGRALAHPATFTSTDVPKVIPPVDPLGVDCLLTVSSSARIVEALPRVLIDHNFTSDISVILEHPDGTQVPLTVKFSTGKNGATYDPRGSAPITTAAGFIVYEGFFLPTGDLTVLRGKPAGGTWKLHVVDDVSASSTGTILKFELLLELDDLFPAMTVRETSTSGRMIGNEEPVSPRRDFGAQTLAGGATPPLRVFVSNAGNDALHLGTPTSSGADFTVDLAGFTPTVTAGASTSFGISFTPQALGRRTGSVTFAHDDAVYGGTSPFRIDVAGDGVAAYPSPYVAAIPPLVPILEGDLAGGSSEIHVNEVGFVSSVVVKDMNIDSTIISALTVTLISPDGTRVQLVRPHVLAGTAGFVGTTFDDAAPAQIGAPSPFTGTFRPMEALSKLAGRSARGVWTLNVADDGGGIDTSFIQGWKLQLVLTPTSPAVLDVLVGGEALTSGAAAAGPRLFGNQPINNGPTTAVTFTVRNAGGTATTLGALSKGGANPDEFLLNAAAFQTTLAPASSTTFSVAFDPASAGVKGATISFTHALAAPPSPFEVLLEGGGVANPPLVVAATGLPQAIPAQGLMTSTIVVTATAFVVDVNVSVDIAHTSDGDLNLALLAPGGQRIPLATARGGSGDNYAGTTFDDQAATAISAGTAAPPFTGSFRPEQPLAQLFATSAVGTWTLEVNDVSTGGSGTLLGWSLSIDYAGGPTADIAVTEDSASGRAIAQGAPAPILIGSAATGGAPVIKRIVVANTAQGTLTIQAPSLSGAGAASFDLPSTGFPRSIAGGATDSFDIALSPVDLGTVTATIAFEHDGTTRIASPFRFDVTARGLDLPPAVVSRTNLGLTIPDGSAAGPGVVDVPLVVSSRGLVTYASVKVRLTHIADEDVELLLIAPDGTTVDLSSDNGTGSANYTNTVFDDLASQAVTAGTAPFPAAYRPEQPLSVFVGKPCAGTWRLRARDDAAGDIGRLEDVTLELGRTPAAELEVAEGAAVIANGAAASGGRAFGPRPLAAGVSAPVTITLRNIGSAALTIGNVALANNASGAFQLSSPGVAGASLAVGQQTSFQVTFHPLSLGVVTASAVITSSDNVASPFTFELSGEGTQPGLQVTAPGGPVPAVVTPGQVFDMGSLSVSGGSRIRQFDVHNSGTATLSLGVPVVTGDASSFVVDAAQLPRILGPGQTGTIFVTFRPRGIGGLAATLSFTHDAPVTTSPFTIGFTGAGTVQLAQSGGGGGGGGGGGCHARPGTADASLPAIFLAALAGLALRSRRRAEASPRRG